MVDQYLNLSNAGAFTLLTLVLHFCRKRSEGNSLALTLAAPILVLYFLSASWQATPPTLSHILLLTGLACLSFSLWTERQLIAKIPLISANAGIVVIGSFLAFETAQILLLASAASALVFRQAEKDLSRWLAAFILGSTALCLVLGLATMSAVSYSLCAFALAAVIISDTYQQLYLQANSDPLSQLPNRRCLNEQAQRRTENQESYWLLLLTIDGIKQINDTYGFAAGDAAIWIASRKMLEAVGPEDFLGRNFAKEFVIISQRDRAGVIQLQEDIEAKIKDIQSVDQHNVTMSIHCGVSFNEQAQLEFSQSLKSSSAALQYCEAHSQTLTFVNDDILASVNRRNDLEQGLRMAIAEKSLQVHFQPKYDCHEPERIVGAEALARWQYQGKPVSPFEFIKLAEECNLIADLDQVIMEKAWVLGKQLQQRGLPIKIAANFSPTSLLNGVSLLEMVSNIIHRNQLDPRLIEIEITESYLAHGDDIKHQLQVLRKMGATIAMDDFGTGFSNLGQLEGLPLDTLKIDKIFVDKLLENPTVTEFIVDLAQKLQLQLVAEGVEETQQLQWLSQHSCQMIQGYLLSRPLPEDEFVKLLETKHKQPAVLKLAK